VQKKETTLLVEKSNEKQKQSTSSKLCKIGKSKNKMIPSDLHIPATT